jgi:hypothetical protein
MIYNMLSAPTFWHFRSHNIKGVNLYQCFGCGLLCAWQEKPREKLGARTPNCFAPQYNGSYSNSRHVTHRKPGIHPTTYHTALLFFHTKYIMYYMGTHNVDDSSCFGSKRKFHKRNKFPKKESAVLNFKTIWPKFSTRVTRNKFGMALMIFISLASGM